MIRLRIAITFFLLVFSVQIQANDLVRIGTGTRAMGMANITGLSGDPLASLSGNPALLASQPSSVQFSMTSIINDSSFSNVAGPNTDHNSGPNFVPDVAALWSPSGSRFSLAAGVIVNSALKADYTFQDVPGTLGVSYGEQGHKAEYIVVSAVLGLAYEVNDRFSVGATLGFAANRNRMKAPYIFQSHPVLGGLKVLVSLDTDDTGIVSRLGMNYRITENVSFNTTYMFETNFVADGDLKGNLSALGLGIQPEFIYDTEVSTGVPRNFSAGIDWQTSDTLKLGFQVDWINWKKSFDALPLRLRNGDNAELNAFLGSNAIDDTAPLDWRDQYVFHLAGEYRYSDVMTLRAGYEYSNVTVPTSTLAPMAGAILDHVICFGLGYQFEKFQLDLAYRWSIDNAVNVEDSALLGVEYDNTRLKTGLHSLGVSIWY
jgi:long-chain fatty acid transport protein